MGEVSYKAKCLILGFIAVLLGASAIYTYPLRIDSRSEIVLPTSIAESANESIDSNIYKSDEQGLVNIVHALKEKGFSIEYTQITDEYIDYLLSDGDLSYRIIYYINTHFLYGFCTEYRRSFEVFENINPR